MEPMVNMRAFSMNMPFAGLIAHGEKTIETRNHTMFEGSEGQRMALHVGQVQYMTLDHRCLSTPVDQA